MLNLDVYHELAQEFVILGDEDPELTARFILSGKESLISLKQSLRNVETIHFWNSLFYDDDNCPRYSSYVVTIKWSDDVKVNTELEDSYMDPIIRWTLNSVKRVEIDAYKPLPMDVIELLLRNSSFTEIELYHCDSSTLKTLIESRKFNHVYMERSIFLNLNDVHINTEKLELHYVSLENILKTEFLKTNSLMLYSNEEFNDRIFEMNNISLNFQSLENLELVVRGRDVFHDPQKILGFLQFLNTKLTNLNLLVLDFNEFRPDLVYNNDEGIFNMSPNSLKNLVNYEDKLTIYNGKVKVKLNHYFDFKLISSSKEAVENYLKSLKGELRDFEYSSWIEGNDTYYQFKKFSNVTENLEFNVLVRLNHWLG